MILEALAEILNATGLDSLPLFGDTEEAELPFQIFSNEQKPLRVKGAILGYDNAVEIAGFNTDLEGVIDDSTIVKAAIQAMEGETIQQTIVVEVTFTGGDPYYDTNFKCYRQDNTFDIHTKNQ